MKKATDSLDEFFKSATSDVGKGLLPDSVVSDFQSQMAKIKEGGLARPR